MDKKQVITWLIGIMARGIAWALAAKWGLGAVEAQTAGQGIAEGLGSAVLVAISTWHSISERKRLLNTPPPSTGA